jgi:hypothetical protein
MAASGSMVRDAPFGDPHQEGGNINFFVMGQALA